MGTTNLDSLVLSGNLEVAGTETITGSVTYAGNVTLGDALGDATTVSGTLVTSGTTSTSGAGAVAITGTIHEVTTTGTGDALTLADGAEGQRLAVVYIAEGAGGDTAVITPTNFGGGSTITLNAVGDTVDLIFTNGNWYELGLGGTAAVA